MRIMAVALVGAADPHGARRSRRARRPRAGRRTAPRRIAARPRRHPSRRRGAGAAPADGRGTGHTGGAACARSAARRRLSRDGADRRVRRRPAATHAHGPAQRDVRPASACGPSRHGRRLPQQRQHVPQRLFALEGQALRPRRYARGKSKAVQFDTPGHRARLLRHPLAHERVRPGLRPPVLRHDRRRRPIPHRQHPARHLHRRRVARGPDARGARRRRSRRRAGWWSRTSRSSDAGRPRRSPIASSWPARCWRSLSLGFAFYFVNERASAEAEADLRRGLVEAGTLVDQYGATRIDHFTRLARVVADLPKLKAAVETGDPPTVQPLADEYRTEVGADLLVLTGRDGGGARRRRRRRGDDRAPRGYDAQSLRGDLHVHAARARRAPAGQRADPARGRASRTFSAASPWASSSTIAWPARSRRLTGSEIAFGAQGRILASTLPPDARAALAPAMTAASIGSVTIGDEEFVTLARPLVPRRRHAPASPASR